MLTAPQMPLAGGDKVTGQPAPPYPSFTAYVAPVGIIKGPQWLYSRSGADPGIGANWNIYPNTGWVGVALANCDNVPLADLSQLETQAITGQPASGGGGG